MENQTNEVEEILNEVENKSNNERKQKILKEITSWIISLLVSVVIAYLFIQFIGQFVIVQQNSMTPTLKNNDVLFTQKISVYTKTLKRGDIVTVYTGNMPGEEPRHLIKRLIGLPGDTITLIDEVSVIVKDKNGVEQTFYNINPSGYEGPFIPPQIIRARTITLAEDEVYLLGDNRGGSQDSTELGPFKYSDLKGAVLFRFFPINTIGTVK